MFFISPQIFQIEYSENMNEMEVCVRPWYLWDVTLVCRDGNYKDWHKYLGTFGSGWAACCTGTCSVVELYLISLSLSQWAVYILWQPQSVQLHVGSGGRRCPSCCPGAALWPQSTSSPGVAQPWDWPYQKWSLPYWSQKLVALGGHDGNSKLRSAEIYDPGSDLLLFRLDMDDLM